MRSIEEIFVGAAGILILSIFASKASEKYGVPALLLFLFIGMLAGSEGPGGVHFDDPWIAQAMGVTALAFILFAGGMDTRWSDVRPVGARAFALSTLGVAVTSGVVGLSASYVLGFSLIEGLLLGSIISSTDAAAVFSVLRSRNIGLPDRVKHLLEFESGSNDPMAVFLTVAFVTLLTQEANPGALFVRLFLIQMTVGGILGLGLGWLLAWIVNHIGLETEGLYPVLTLSWVLLTYGVIVYLGGNAFLGIYISGLIVGNGNFVHKNSLLRFHDGVAWLMQIVMFLILGLLVFPSRLLPVVGSGLLLCGILMFLARPLAVCVPGIQQVLFEGENTDLLGRPARRRADHISHVSALGRSAQCRRNFQPGVFYRDHIRSVSGNFHSGRRAVAGRDRATAVQATISARI